MHECYMIFAVFALIFRCWTFCLLFDLIKVFVLPFTSPFAFPLSEGAHQNEEGIRGRAPTVLRTVPHGCASKLFRHVAVWTIHYTCEIFISVIRLEVFNDINDKTI